MAKADRKCQVSLLLATETKLKVYKTFSVNLF